MSKYETRTTTVTVIPEGQSLFDEWASQISIRDEAAGEFVEVEQFHDKKGETVLKVDPVEWPALRAAIDTMIAECRETDDTKPD